MSWNYRIVKYRDGSGYGLHEVYYDADGKPWGMTRRPCSFGCDLEEGPQGIVTSLLTARVDARKRAILDEPKKWPGKSPGTGRNFRLTQTSKSGCA